MAIEFSNGTNDIVVTYKNKAGTVTREDYIPKGSSEFIKDVRGNQMIINKSGGVLPLAGAGSYTYKFEDVTVPVAASLDTLFALVKSWDVPTSGGGSTTLVEYQIPQEDVTGTEDTFTLPFLIDTDSLYYVVNGQFYMTKYDGITSVTNGESDCVIVFTDPIPLDNVVVVNYKPA